MTTTGRLVYRPLTGTVLVGCYAAFAAWWILAGLTSSRHAGLSWTALAWMLAIGTVLYAAFWRPAVIVDDDGVLLCNVVRDVRVPWAALEGVETQYALTLVTAQHRYSSWAAGAPGRRNALARTGHGRGIGAGVGDTARAAVDVEARHLPRKEWMPGGMEPNRSSRDLRTDSGAAAFMVEQAWMGWRDDPRAREAAGGPVPPVPVSWNVPILVAVPLLVATALLAGAIGV